MHWRHEAIGKGIANTLQILALFTFHDEMRKLKGAELRENGEICLLGPLEINFSLVSLLT